MKPILYDSTEKAFTTNGIGVLCDTLSCVVKEEKNGSYELAMSYPVDGMHFAEIVSRAIILAKPNDEDRLQPFRVCQITKPINGIVEIAATHISYDLSGVAVSPFSATGISQAMSDMQTNSIPSDHGFSLTSDLGGTGTMSVNVPSSFRSLLGGSRGSLLDVYGGEYKYDRFDVSLLENRGKDRGFEIRYGENMTDFNQDENCSNVYTDVYPYWSGGEANVYLSEKTIRAEGTYNFTRVLPLDMSEYFEDAPDEASLRAAAKKYMTANKIGVPKVSLKLSYEDFAEYKNKVALCDTVKVVFPKYNVSTSAKIVSVEYDVLAERYISLEIGSTVSGIADTIADQREEIEAKPSKSLVEIISSKLAAGVLGAKGGSVRFIDTDGDGELDTLYIADDPDPAQAQKVWQFNYQGWAASENGYNGPFTMGATLQDGLLANFVTAAHLVAGTIQSVSGNFFINLDGGTILTSAQKTTYTTSDYTASDETRITDILLGRVIPTLTDYEKYDVDGNGYFTITDQVMVSQIVAGMKEVNFSTSWALQLDPANGDNLFKVYRTHHDNIANTDTEYLVFSVGFANIVGNTIDARYGIFDNDVVAKGNMKCDTIDASTYKKNGSIIAFPEEKVIGYVVACSGSSGIPATCFIPAGKSGTYQCASNDWYCSFSFSNGSAVKKSGTSGTSVDSCTAIYNM